MRKTRTRRFRIYRNLTKSCYSIQRYVPNRGWRLLAHTRGFEAHDCVFKVYESGRKRGIKEGKKYVHAFIECARYNTVSPVELGGFITGQKVSYVPSVAGHFFFAEDPKAEIVSAGIIQGTQYGSLYVPIRGGRTIVNFLK